MNSHTILVDSDGVLSNFVEPFLDKANKITGLSKTVDDILEWNFLPLYPKDRHEEILGCVEHPGWCRSLNPYPGAREGVDELRKLGDVYCVTAPWTSPTWHYERTQWLKEHMGFDADHVVHAFNKWIIPGLTLIDDKIETLVKWTEATGGTGILWTQPYNRTFDGFGKNIWRAKTWEDVVVYVKALAHLNSHI